MQRGTKHKPETIEKLRRLRKDGPIDAGTVIAWLNGLTHDEFDAFVRCHIIPRIKRQ